MSRILEAKALACHDIAKRYYGTDRYSYTVKLGEQLALVLMDGTEDTLRKLRDTTDDEALRNLIERAYSHNLNWAPRDSIAAQPVGPKRLTLSEIRDLEEAEPISSDEMRELLANLPKEFWDGVATMMVDQAKRFEAARKSITPTYEDMHRPFDL
jgi:hypothetical protein